MKNSSGSFSQPASHLPRRDVLSRKPLPPPWAMVVTIGDLPHSRDQKRKSGHAFLVVSYLLDSEGDMKTPKTEVKVKDAIRFLTP